MGNVEERDHLEDLGMDGRMFIQIVISNLKTDIEYSCELGCT